MVDFWMLNRSSKVINGGGRALVLHAQRMKMVSNVQPVVRELSDSWHRSAFDSRIHIIKMNRYPRTLCGKNLKHRLSLLQIYKALTAINFKQRHCDVDSCPAPGQGGARKRL